MMVEERRMENYQGMTTCGRTRRCRSTTPTRSVGGVGRRRSEGRRRGNWGRMRCRVEPRSCVSPSSPAEEGTADGGPERLLLGRGKAWARLAPCLAKGCSLRPMERTVHWGCWSSRSAARRRCRAHAHAAGPDGCWNGHCRCCWSGRCWWRRRIRPCGRRTPGWRRRC